MAILNISYNIINLESFISEERKYLFSLDNNIEWEKQKWDVRNWLFHRGKDHELLFNAQTRILSTKSVIDNPPTGPLPAPYTDFVKAVAVYLQRTKGVGYMAVRNYVNECRRLYIVMHQRRESCATSLTRWHFERTLEYLEEIEYKNIYDAAANLQVIAEVLDKKHLTPYPIDFKHGLTPNQSFHNYKAITNLADDEKRKDDEKLPSYEAMAAYAQCTNAPINNDEEILLRTIDLLIAMGQRGNEVALLPSDCWVEKPETDKKGNVIIDANGSPITKVGIRYYAEKQFQSRVHWLAEQDIPFARRAIDRLLHLTKDVRDIAKWQEDNPGRLWKYKPDEIVDDDTILNYLGFASVSNLQLFLTQRNGIKPQFIDTNPYRPYLKSGKRSIKRYHYQAGDIEKLLLPKLNNHVALKEQYNGQWKTILKTSDLLCLRFDGAFRFKRSNNTFKLLPGRVTLTEINAALGGIPGIESIFERRNLTEADCSKIVLTSHQPRHWRNTLYELAGMSNIQQALAMGRQKLDQNATYQHTTLSERTQLHKEFIIFNSPADKVLFLHDGVRNKSILGDITDTYHFLKEEKGILKAEDFLKTHALALHITPFGGCTHDFSQAPCTMHLQCWNGCSHLHRTNAPGEAERIKEQLELSLKSLANMKKDGLGEYGSDVWIADLETKIANLEKGLHAKVTGDKLKIFPDGIPVTVPIHQHKSSSVSEK